VQISIATAASMQHQLDMNDLHVWYADLDCLEPKRLAFEQTLAPDELTRASRYHRQKDASRFIACRGLLRALLSQYVALSPRQLKFSYGSFGKPELLYPQFPLHFNVTHSESVAVIAIAARPVGIDCEFVRENRDLTLIAEMFTPGERDSMARLTASDFPTAFFHCWTRKEAYLKARGCGLSLPLDQVQVSVSPDEPPALVSVEDDHLEPSRWCLLQLSILPLLAVSVAIQAPAPDLTLRPAHNAIAEQTHASIN
jgi:4'-phosphopantetheinyl transferase